MQCLSLATACKAIKALEAIASRMTCCRLCRLQNGGQVAGARGQPNYDVDHAVRMAHGRADDEAALGHPQGLPLIHPLGILRSMAAARFIFSHVSGPS